MAYPRRRRPLRSLSPIDAALAGLNVANQNVPRPGGSAAGSGIGAAANALPTPTTGAASAGIGAASGAIPTPSSSAGAGVTAAAPYLSQPSSVPGSLTNTEDLRDRLFALPERQGLDARNQQQRPRYARQIASRLERAVENSGPDVAQFGDLGPDAAELAKWSVKFGRRYDVPPSVLFGQQGIESAWGGNLGPSTAGARGWTQFMPETRQGYIEQHGVDPWKNPRSAVKAQAIYQQDFADDPRGKIFSYNHSDAYVDDVLAAAKNYTALDSAQGGKQVPTQLKRTARQEIGKPATKAILRGGKLVRDRAGGGNKHELSVKEMFYDPGVNMDEGVETSAIGDHVDHVHFASDDPRSILMVAKKAQELGMLQGGVGENPAFDEIDSHSGTEADSLHMGEMPLPQGRLAKQTGASGDVLGKALDIAGDAEQMSALNQWIASHAGEGVSTAPPTVPIKDSNLAVRLPAPAPSAAAVGGALPTGGTVPPATFAGAPSGSQTGSQDRSRPAPSLGGTSSLVQALRMRAPQPISPLEPMAAGEEEEDDPSLFDLLSAENAGSRFRPRRRS